MIAKPDASAGEAAVSPGGAAPANGQLNVSRDRLLHDWEGAYARARAYLCALGVPEGARPELATAAVERAAARAVWPAGSHAIAETLRALKELLLGVPPGEDRPPERCEAEFLAWRRRSALPDAPAARVFRSMPRLTRRPMVSERLARGQARAPRRDRPPWRRAALNRRAILAVLVLIPSVVASGFMLEVLPFQGRTLLEGAIVVVFGALFGWISIGFWTAVTGFFVLLGRDRFAITAGCEGDAPEIDPAARTAIVMPICEEPVDRVFAGLRAIHASLARAGALDRFDFFVLSDSANPDTWVQEEAAWAAWCSETDGRGRIFYRRRRVRVKRKSGNVADFCRRWGAQYRYMILLDADSVMAGDALVRLVQIMERHPDVGMVQTVPVAVNRRSLFGRVQQFGSRLYAPMFAAGLHFWQLGEGQYWGHNAIIRVAPFMAHCALARLSGKPPRGGEIMSHDFVEAALMGRAGWSIWLAYDLPGSYEEAPGTLLEEMGRDRRWCQGNLQHLRLLFTEGLFGAHRAIFLNGVMAYVSALLWLLFLGFSTARAIEAVVREPDYFPAGPSLFPEWPIWRPDWALSLLAVTGVILFLPKILGLALVLRHGRGARAFGGGPRLVASVILEVLVSSLLAPIRMVFHSRFVLLNLLGRTVAWRSQQREDSGTGWGEAIRHHGLDTVVASAWAVSVFWLNPDYFWWLTPIVGALVLSIPLSVLASRVRLGDAARAAGLFLIPEEVAPAPELRDLAAGLDAAAGARARRPPPAEHDGLVRAVVDPGVNALRCTLAGERRSLRPSIRARRGAVAARALAEGPAALSVAERRTLLGDPAVVRDLHTAVWAVADVARAARWGRPGAEGA